VGQKVQESKSKGAAIVAFVYYYCGIKFAATGKSWGNQLSPRKKLWKAFQAQSSMFETSLGKNLAS